MINLRYELQGSPSGHPQEAMRLLGITYQVATPQSVSGQWWFWNCKSVPGTLPSYISKFEMAPQEAVGNGLSQKDADALIAHSLAEQKYTIGKFYMVMVATDPDATHEWEAEAMPARFDGYGENGMERWNFLNPEASEWPVRWSKPLEI